MSKRPESSSASSSAAKKSRFAFQFGERVYVRDYSAPTDWRWYRSHVIRLVERHSVPAPTSLDASVSIEEFIEPPSLPTLPYPDSQVIAAVVSLIDSKEQTTNDIIDDVLQLQREQSSLGKNLKMTSEAHTNLANGTVDILERVKALEAQHLESQQVQTGLTEAVESLLERVEAAETQNEELTESLAQTDQAHTHLLEHHDAAVVRINELVAENQQLQGRVFDLEDQVDNLNALANPEVDSDPEEEPEEVPAEDVESEAESEVIDS
jgi:hypothetical protein